MSMLCRKIKGHAEKIKIKLLIKLKGVQKFFSYLFLVCIFQISDLCLQLDRIWEEQGVGFEVLFEWAQFLSEETTTHLHISSPFALTRLSQRYLRQAANNQPRSAFFSCQRNTTFTIELTRLVKFYGER